MRDAIALQGTPSNSFVGSFIASCLAEDVSMTESINMIEAAMQSDTNDEIISQLNIPNALVCSWAAIFLC